MRGLRGLLALMAVAAILRPPASAQAVFDVGSVKPNTTGSQRISMGFTPDGYAAANVPLRLVVLSAYGVRPDQVTGGPAWIDVNRFDIVVKATGGAPRDALRAMLRAWLADRFGLAARVEVRERPVYALVPTRSNGQPGPTLKPSARECAPETMTNPCRISGTIGAATGKLAAVGQTMADLATYLGQNAERPVVDRTGFTGRFDFELAWSADNLNAGLFTAVQEQLGLKLEPARGMVPMVVVEHAELPSPD